MPEQSFQHRKAYAAALLTFLVPGLAHYMLGRRGRGLALFAIVMSTFAMGLVYHGALFTPFADSWLYRLGAIAEMGLGALFFLGHLLGWGGITTARVIHVMYGYGNTFLVTAGLMNMLLAMDAFDIAIGRKT
ncbi:MAG: hypothetical protein P8018_13775 [Acidobacteriota bacterium]|jgi:hypothetical protein